jgi:hypothetical protein
LNLPLTRVTRYTFSFDFTFHAFVSVET